MNTTCHRWAVAGTTWAYRDAATCVADAISSATAVARACRGGRSFFKCGLSTYTVMADEFAAVALHSRHGGPAFRDSF